MYHMHMVTEDKSAMCTIDEHPIVHRIIEFINSGFDVFGVKS